MKHLVIAACVLLSSISPIQARADSCKPDVSQLDKITKQQQDVWTHGVSAVSLGAKVMGATDVAIYVTVGRNGNANAIGVEIFKAESSKDRATFDASLRAVKGNRFLLGFKDGDPLTFVATEAGNESKVKDEILSNRANVVTKVVLSTTVSDAALASMRQALTTKHIDAIRVMLAGDMTIETAVRDRDSKKIMGKFSCFYESVDRIAALAKDPAMAAARGRYLRKGKNADFLDLGADGTWSILQDGKSVRGTFRVEGDKLSLMSPKMKLMGRGTVTADSIKDDEGIIWEKQADTPKTESTNADTAVTLRLGMTPEEVEAAQGGKPQKVIDLGSKKIYIYPDMKIIFVDGKVTDIQ